MHMHIHIHTPPLLGPAPYRSCERANLYYSIAMGSTVLLLLLVALAWRLTGIAHCLAQLWISQRIALFLHVIGLRSKIKIIVSHLQIITQIGSVYVVHYPKTCVHPLPPLASPTPRPPLLVARAARACPPMRLSACLAAQTSNYSTRST